MIGHFLGTLSPAQEDKALTQVMRPGSYHHESVTIGDVVIGVTGPCLVGVTVGNGCKAERLLHMSSAVCWEAGPIITSWLDSAVEARYDGMCKKLGNARTNSLIRNRILANQAWRALRAPVACERLTAVGVAS